MFTGLSDFDALAGPLRRGSVTAAVGRPSVGTTAFALAATRHNLAAGNAVFFLDFQAGGDTVISNLVAAESSVNVDRPNSINAGRRARLQRTQQSLGTTLLWTWTPQEQGRLLAERLVDNISQITPPALLIVDDYGLAACTEEPAGHIMQTLRKIARERNTAVLITAHLSRPSPADTVPPDLGELLDSDHAVADVDAVVLVHRPDRQGAVPERRGEVDLIAEHGWNTKGTITVRFEPEYHRLTDLPNE